MAGLDIAGFVSRFLIDKQKSDHVHFDTFVIYDTVNLKGQLFAYILLYSHTYCFR